MFIKSLYKIKNVVCFTGDGGRPFSISCGNIKAAGGIGEMGAFYGRTESGNA
jgi:hypothetical protein